MSRQGKPQCRVCHLRGVNVPGQGACRDCFRALNCVALAHVLDGDRTEAAVRAAKLDALMPVLHHRVAMRWPVFG